MGPEIAQDRERDVDTLSPGFKARDVISQNTQDLGVVGREKVLQFLIGGQLARSDRCKGSREKSE